MNNIFENAFFGKVYKTRDNRKAIFSHIFYSKADNEEFAVLIVPKTCITDFNADTTSSLNVSLDGLWHLKKYDSPNDIVSEWNESI